MQDITNLDASFDVDSVFNTGASKNKNPNKRNPTVKKDRGDGGKRSRRDSGAPPMTQQSVAQSVSTDADAEEEGADEQVGCPGGVAHTVADWQVGAGHADRDRLEGGIVPA